MAQAATARAHDGPADAPRWPRRLAGVLLLALVGFAPLAIGTVHAWTRLVVFLGAAAALLLVVLDHRARARTLPITWPLVTVALAVLATALQLVPWPSAVIARLSPGAHDVFSALPGGYRWHALTVDPPGTLAELAKLGGYLAFLAAATAWASRSHRRRRLLLAVAAVTTAAAVLAIVQYGAESWRIYFLYEPATGARGAFGPFVNPNHFGALMTLGAPIVLMVALGEPRLRWAAYAALVVVNLAVILSMCRSAILVAPAAQVLALLLARWQERPGRSRDSTPGRDLRIALVVALVAGVAVAASMGQEQLEREIEVTERVDLPDPLGETSSKGYAWNRALELIPGHAWTGVGRGAFEQAFTRVTTRGGTVRFPWVENQYLQPLTDWGLVVGGLILALAAWSMLQLLRRFPRDSLAVGALLGLLGLAVHEAVDFATEIPGVALPALAVIATLFARRKDDHDAVILSRPPGAAYLALPALLAATAMFAHFQPLAGASARGLAALSRDPAVATETVVQQGHRLRRRHPGDYMIPALVGERLARDRRPEALAWLNDAILLNPTHPAPHLAAAELLAASGRRSQALVEYRSAVGHMPAPGVVWERVARRYPDVEALLGATPFDADRLAALGVWLRRAKRTDDAAAVVARAAALDPRHLPSRQLLLELALDRKDAAARQLADELLAADRSPRTTGLVIRAYLATGDLVAAARLLEGEPRTAQTFSLGLALADALSRAGDHEGARASLARLGGQADKQQLIRLHEARSAVERRAGNTHQADWEKEQAARLRGK